MLRPQEALFANASFYSAFRNRDFDTLQQLWSTQYPCVCVHPGWPALTERDEILLSWNRILSGEQAPKISIYGEKTVASANVVFVICYEVIDSAVLVATNVFTEENGAPVIISHHSGQCANPPPRETVQ